MQRFVAAVHACGPSVEFPQIGETLFYGFEVFFVAALLVVDGRFLDALCQIYAMYRKFAAEQVVARQLPDEVESLFMQQFRQVEQECVARDVVEPVNGLHIVADAVKRPE